MALQFNLTAAVDDRCIIVFFPLFPIFLPTIGHDVSGASEAFAFFSRRPFNR